MDITRLTELLGADPGRVEALIVQIEREAPDRRSPLLGELARALGFSHAEPAAQGAGHRELQTTDAAAPRTDLADAAAIDLGFD